MLNNMMKNGCIIVQLILMVVLVMPLIVASQNSTRGSRNETSKLRLLIPVRPGLNKFVNIERHAVTGVQNFSGFAIGVFEGIVNYGLPSPVPYEFVPFAKPDGTMNGSFDDMLEAISAEGYDGAVGEISVLHYRTPWVDFTIPYQESQISMLVRINQQSIGKGSIPMASVTKYIVAATLAFCFLVAIIFWILEYKSDKHSSQPNDTGSFQESATNVQDELRTSQTSSLTAQHEGGTRIKTIEQLIRNKLNVGHRQGSFIRNLLIQKGIPEGKLISLSSEEEMTEMLSKGTAKGGVDAIFGDSPNLNLFLANDTKHCGLFTIAPNAYIDTVGFGFAFHKETSLAKEFSEGLLKLIDTGRLETIRQSTIGNLDDTCAEDDDIGGSTLLLGSDSFWILIAGAITVFILMIIILLLYCGLRRNGRKKKAIAYPCYLLPCC
ncbi:Glutamate receptor 2.6 [Bienertia sinuspersici]